jgi:hypothetical protein
MYYAIFVKDLVYPRCDITSKYVAAGILSCGSNVCWMSGGV